MISQNPEVYLDTSGTPKTQVPQPRSSKYVWCLNIYGIYGSIIPEKVNNILN